MRLTPHEIAAIRECAIAHFGEGTVVRLFGSRTDDTLRGGDIDLHIVAGSVETSSRKTEWDFKAALYRRIGEQRVDTIVQPPEYRARPIDDVAALTGQIILGEERDCDAANEMPGERARMTSEAYGNLAWNAIASGRAVKARLDKVLRRLKDRLPLDAKILADLDETEQVLTDSLLLQFNNLVAIVRDQLLRALLLACTGEADTRNRADQQRQAEAHGILPPGLDLQSMAVARNLIAHQYPADPARQAMVFESVLAALPQVIEVFDILANYAETHLQPEGGHV